MHPRARVKSLASHSARVCGARGLADVEVVTEADNLVRAVCARLEDAGRAAGREAKLVGQIVCVLKIESGVPHTSGHREHFVVVGDSALAGSDTAGEESSGEA